MFEITAGMGFLGLIVILAILFFIIAAKSVVIVPNARNYVVERLGKFHQTYEAGFHLLIPFVDRVAARISLQEQIINIPRQPVITKDNVTVNVDGICYILIQDPYKATYGVVNLGAAISNLSTTTMRSVVGSLELDEILSNRDRINASIVEGLDEASRSWGSKIMRVEISEISVPVDIQRAMEMQMTAEREKRAIETKAEADKTKVTREAEAVLIQAQKSAEAIELTAKANAFAQRATAEAQKDAMININEAMANNQLAANFLLEKDRIGAWGTLAENEGVAKWIVPGEFAGMMSGIGVIADAFKDFSGKDGK